MMMAMSLLMASKGKRSWQTEDIPNGPSARTHHQIAVAQDAFYVFGGGSQATTPVDDSSVYTFDFGQLFSTVSLSHPASKEELDEPAP